MLNYPDHCVLYRFLPRSLTETDMELVWLVRGDAKLKGLITILIVSPGYGTTPRWKTNTSSPVTRPA